MARINSTRISLQLKQDGIRDKLHRIEDIKQDLLQMGYTYQGNVAILDALRADRDAQSNLGLEGSEGYACILGRFEEQFLCVHRFQQEQDMLEWDLIKEKESLDALFDDFHSDMVIRAGVLSRERCSLVLQISDALRTLTEDPVLREGFIDLNLMKATIDDELDLIKDFMHHLIFFTY